MLRIFKKIVIIVLLLGLPIPASASLKSILTPFFETDAQGQMLVRDFCAVNNYEQNKNKNETQIEFTIRIITIWFEKIHEKNKIDQNLEIKRQELKDEANAEMEGLGE
jgi:hypothetical protein